ncbi:MAG: type II secretion system protein E [Porticoccaceae bacterium]|nr:MAG: type II secretion system protein E [Porticoccaceae bacterium]
MAEGSQSGPARAVTASQVLRTAEDLRHLRPSSPPLTEAELGARLVAAGLLDRSALREILREKHRTGRPFLETMARLGHLDEATKPAVLALRLGIPLVHIAEFEADPEALALLPQELLARYEAFPLGVVDGVLVIAVPDPTHGETLQALSFASPLPIEVAMAPREEIRALLTRHLLTTAQNAILAELDREEGNEPADSEGDSRALHQSAARKPVVRFVDALLRKAIAASASDLHLRPTEEGGEIHFRIDGKLVFERALPRRHFLPVVYRLKILSDMDVAERRLPQDGHFSLHEEGRRIDFRVSAIPTVAGESLAIRVLDKAHALLGLDELGLPAAEIARLRRLLARTHGIFLVTGPTGSGKSTTLYAIVAERRRANPHLITVEDPVEYRLEGVEQIQVNPRIGFDFAEALRHILRHDPDEILVGEMRDVETAQIAVRAALTGHFVLSTLHTNDAAGTLARLLDMGIEPYLINSTLVGVLAQRLVRRICTACAAPDPDEARLREYFALPADFPARLGRGCARCHHTGYRGRIMVGELLEVTAPLRALIARRAEADELRRQARADGMVPLAANALEVARAGITSLEEVFKVRLE